MKIRLPFALVGLAISFALPTYGQQKYLADRQTVQKISESLWEEAVLKGDAAAIAAHYTPDAVFVAPEGPIIGREAIQKWYANNFQHWQPTTFTAPWDENGVHIIGTDVNQVWASGEWNQSGPGQSGQPISVKGRYLDIDVREGDDWKVRASAINVTPAPQPAATPSPDDHREQPIALETPSWAYPFPRESKFQTGVALP
jgi:ketosteroid isomerase-like protein